MASVFLLVFFLLSHLPLLHSTEEEMRNTERCPTFHCGDLPSIPFPFAESSHPECGVFTVDCVDSQPWIRFGPGGGSYLLHRISPNKNFSPDNTFSPNNTLSPNDTLQIVVEGPSRRFEHPPCESLTNLSFPSSSFFSIKIVPGRNQTFFKCNSTLHLSPCDFKNISCVDNSTIYFSNFSNESSAGAFPGCSIIQLPKNLGHDPKFDDLDNPNSRRAKVDDSSWLDNPLSLVAPYMELVVNVSRECYECYEEGGQCKARANGRFYCKKGLNKKQKIGIGVGCSLVGVLCLVLIIYLGKRRGVFSKMQAKRTYSGPSSRSDVEAGSVYFGVPVYSYSELEEATNNFDVERELGEGGFGTVYYGKLCDGREVAIKRLYEHNYKRVAQFMNEVEILTRLRHRNLVSLYGCTSKRSRELLLVYEYIPNGTVADHIHGDRATPGSPPWPTRMSIAIETASALAYLHASDIIHRDVKTNNILLDHNFCVKVADFGLSRLFPFNVTHVSTAPQGTPGYVDPEYRRCYQLTTKSDVYSFGVVLIELISSLPAVDLARQRHDINLTNLALKRIERSEYQELIDSHLGFEWDKEVQRMTISVAQLAFRCIQHDKELRPSMDEVLEVLKHIQSGNEAPDDRGKAVDDDGIMSIKPPTSRDSDEVGLLKATPLPPSPNSVTDDWTSSPTTPNVSS